MDESEAFVTAMLASVVRSLAEGPKTETELDQVCVCLVWLIASVRREAF